ncbi:hypothetical protein [Shewanella livingstonensis]|nr:hypothetical protein [Shewanella livingstonensis]
MRSKAFVAQAINKEAQKYKHLDPGSKALLGRREGSYQARPEMS